MKTIRGIRLRIQCANVYDHAKILPINSFLETAPPEKKLEMARRMGEIICGNSTAYIYKPRARSPIGKCVLCGGALSFEIQEWEGESLKTAEVKRG